MFESTVLLGTRMMTANDNSITDDVVQYDVVYDILTCRTDRSFYISDDDEDIGSWHLPLMMASLEVTAISPSVFRATHS